MNYFSNILDVTFFNPISYTVTSLDKQIEREGDCKERQLCMGDCL